MLTLMLHMLMFTIVPWSVVNVLEEDTTQTVEGPYKVTISPASAGTDDTLPSLSMSYTSTEYTPVHGGPLEEGHKDMLIGVSNDLQITMQYVTPVSVSVRYTKHPLASVSMQQDGIREAVKSTSICIHVYTGVVFYLAWVGLGTGNGPFGLGGGSG